MRRALEGIYPATAFQRREEPGLFATTEELAGFQPHVSCRILIDGLALRSFPYPHTGVVHGDARSLCIAMASIVAKVVRDRAMARLAVRFPGYGWQANAGYATALHRDALRRLGATVHHRAAFGSVAQLNLDLTIAG